MKKDVIFTICAKNYLAQALSLRESTLKYNDVDFYIFLSDKNDEEGLPEVILLDDEWIPNWQQMAFKYNVIEFSTSIKPFCFQKLFKDGYKKVIYLDPDIYVLNNLDYVFENLEKYSIILTPHRCNIFANDNLISEQSILGVGIYNLGFIAIKNDKYGIEATTWWCKKLTNQCKNKPAKGLFVDQKWIDFIPAYFPKVVLISSHLGLNVATWNLSERKVSYIQNTWYVSDIKQSKTYKLLFFHFSRYSPLKSNQLDKRKPETHIKNYNHFKKLTEEYLNCELRNNFDFYSKLHYSFNFFTDGTTIIQPYRELYDCINNKSIYGDPFDSNGKWFTTLITCKLMKKTNQLSHYNKIKKTPIKGFLNKLMYTLLKIAGPKQYYRIKRKFAELSDLSYEKYLFIDQ